MAVSQKQARLRARNIREHRTKLDKLLDQRDDIVEKVRRARADLKSVVGSK